MAFLSTLQKTQRLRITGMLPLLVDSLSTTKDIASNVKKSALPSFEAELAPQFNELKFVQKFALSPYEADLTAKFLALNFNSAFESSTSHTLPSSLRLPTLDKYTDIEYHTPVIKPCIEDGPTANILEKFDPLSSLIIEEPPTSLVIRKEAKRGMLVIRRKKIKKHKIKKLRKKMKYVRMKKRQKSEYQKEKLFQAEQMAKIREAQAFDPVVYVNNVVAEARASPFKDFVPHGVRDLVEKYNKKHRKRSWTKS